MHVVLRTSTCNGIQQMLLVINLAHLTERYLSAQLGTPQSLGMERGSEDRKLQLWHLIDVGVIE